MAAEVEPDHHLVVDGGSGLRNLRARLGSGPQRFTFVLTHYHWDHLQGLPMFPPLYDESSVVTFVGRGADADAVAGYLRGVLQPPWFPVAIDDSPADVRYRALDGDLEVGPVRVRHTPLQHPQSSTAYRLDGVASSIVVATDHEAGDGAVDAALIELASGADVLMHDGQYTPEEQATVRRGWGHSTWEQAAAAANASGVGRLVLTSHDPDRADDEIDDLVAAAAELFPATEAAFEGLTLPL